MDHLKTVKSLLPQESELFSKEAHYEKKVNITIMKTGLLFGSVFIPQNSLDKSSTTFLPKEENFGDSLFLSLYTKPLQEQILP